MSGREGGPVVIVAGGGDLPEIVADRLSREGRAHKILALRGFAGRPLTRRADAVVGMLDVRRALAHLDDWAPSCVTMVGGVRRPRSAAVLDAFAAFRSRHEIAALLARGDDNLLRGVMDLLEERGHRLVGVHEFAPDLLASPGHIAGPPLDDAGQKAASLGARLLQDLSGFDIGQAAVVDGERVLAIEGPEGTDAMLARVRALSRRWFRRSPRRGVLVKVAKLGQDRRVDLPAIGPRTVKRAAAAGLAGIAVSAGSTLVLDRTGTAREADRLGVALAGLEPAGTEFGA